MNDSSNAAPAEAAESPFSTGKPAPKGSQLRLTILLIILVLAAIALGYDRLVALRGFNQATKKLDALIAGGEDPPVSSADQQDADQKDADQKDADKKDADKEDTDKEGSGEEDGKQAKKKGSKQGGGSATMTLDEPDEEELAKEPLPPRKKKSSSRAKPIVFGIEDIHRELAKEPALAGKAAEAPKLLPARLVTDTDPKSWANRHGYWELYRWRRGLPFKFYELIVIYSGPNEPLFSNYVGDKPLAPDNFSGVAIPIFDEENPPQGRAPVAAGAGMGGPGKGGGKKKGKRPEGAKKGDAAEKGAAKKGAGDGDAKKGGDAEKGDAKDAPKSAGGDQKAETKKQDEPKKDAAENKEKEADKGADKQN